MADQVICTLGEREQTLPGARLGGPCHPPVLLTPLEPEQIILGGVEFHLFGKPEAAQLAAQRFGSLIGRLWIIDWVPGLPIGMPDCAEMVFRIGGVLAVVVPGEAQPLL